MKKKILLLLHLPPPYYGVTLCNQNILEGNLSKYFCLDPIAINTSFDLTNIKKKSPKKGVIFLKVFLKVLKKLINNKYNLCYFSLTPTGIGFYKDLFFVLPLKVFRIKTLYHLHGKGISTRKSFIDRILYKWCFKNTKVILMSRSLLYDLRRYVTEQSIYVVSNGIKNSLSTDEFKKVCDNRATKKVVTLLFLSNMIRSKGVFTALEAAKILKERGLKFRLCFVGGWGDIRENEFHSLMEKLGLRNTVIYLGFKDGEEKNKALKEADIFVYPTYNDTFPLVLLEAMEFGLPVVSTDEGAIPEIIENGVNGFIIPRKDYQGLADELEKLIRDPSLRMEMGRVGREKFLRMYTFEKFENCLVEVFKRLI